MNYANKFDTYSEATEYSLTCVDCHTQIHHVSRKAVSTIAYENGWDLVHPTEGMQSYDTICPVCLIKRLEEEDRLREEHQFDKYIQTQYRAFIICGKCGEMRVERHTDPEGDLRRHLNTHAWTVDAANYQALCAVCSIVSVAKELSDETAAI